MKACKYCGEEHNLPGYACRVCKDGKHRYGLTRNDQIRLYESQDKKCCLCENEIEMFVGHKGGFIDHDHSTGKVRGILCNRCNTVVGGLENYKNLTKLLHYMNIGV